MSIVLQAMAWVFLFYLHTRTLKMAEISRQKDSLVKQLEELIKWALDNQSLEIQNNRIEERFAALVVRNEWRLTQLNSCANVTILEPSSFHVLYNLDVVKLAKEQALENKIFGLTNDLIEKIEIRYQDIFYKTNIFRYMILFRLPELYGLVFPFALFVLLIHLMELITK